MEMDSCHARLCVAQLHSSAIVFDAHAQAYRLVHVRFRRARVLGICVCVAHTQQQQVQLQIDDGSGVLTIRVDQDTAVPDRETLAPGAMIDCMGRIDEPWPPSEDTCERRWLQAVHINVVQDLNLETLRMLEVLHLFERDYAVPPRSSSSSPSPQLLAFPSLHGVVHNTRSPSPGMKRKTPPVQQRPEAHAVEQSHARTVIERPQVQSVRGVLEPDSVVPPRDYYFNVSSGDLKFVESGIKTLELRLNVTPFSFIRVNDRITMNGRTVTTVKAVRKYSQLASILETEELSALRPRQTQTGVTSASTSMALHHFRQFFSAVEEEQHGVVVFQLAVIGAQTAPSSVKSEEEWSKLVYTRLEEKQDTGCTVQDLQFAFPALPVDQIQEILTAMQLDGVVYAMKGRYRLL